MKILRYPLALLAVTIVLSACDAGAITAPAAADEAGAATSTSVMGTGARDPNAPEDDEEANRS